MFYQLIFLSFNRASKLILPLSRNFLSLEFGSIVSVVWVDESFFTCGFGVLELVNLLRGLLKGERNPFCFSGFAMFFVALPVSHSLSRAKEYRTVCKNIDIKKFQPILADLKRFPFFFHPLSCHQSFLKNSDKHHR